MNQDNLPDTIIANYSLTAPIIAILKNVDPTTLSTENTLTDDNSFFVYPVDADTLGIQLTNDYTGQLSLHVYSLQGALLKELKTIKTTRTFSSNLNIASLSTGVYLISVKLNSKVNVIKFIKK